MPSNLTKKNHIYLIYTYKEYLALNNLQWLICHKTKPNLSINEFDFFADNIIFLEQIALTDQKQQ